MSVVATLVVVAILYKILVWQPNKVRKDIRMTDEDVENTHRVYGLWKSAQK